jgi:tetratricopeptide (TPR) repeat protein
MNNLAVTLTKSKRYDEAGRVLAQLLELDETTGRQDHPDYAVHLHSLGELSLARGDFASARRSLERAHDLYQKRGSPNLGLVAFELAQCAARAGDRERAMTWLVEAKEKGYLRAGKKAVLDASEFHALEGDPRFTALRASLKE